MDSKPSHVIGGSKGGVGKPLVAMTSDTSNADAFNAHREQVATELVNLDEADRWISLVNLCDSHRDRGGGQHRARNNKGAQTDASTPCTTALTEEHHRQVRRDGNALGNLPPAGQLRTAGRHGRDMQEPSAGNASHGSGNFLR